MTKFQIHQIDELVCVTSDSADLFFVDSAM